MLNLRTRPEKNAKLRILLHGAEKTGKTSLAAMAEDPVFIMSKGEDGLEGLIRNNQIPGTPYFPMCRHWRDLEDYCHQLATEKHDRKTLVLDVVRGFERMLDEHLIEEEFNGDAKAYNTFAAGRKVSVPAWKRFLNDTLGAVHRRGMIVILVAHSKNKIVKTPMEEDVLNYYPDSEECFWDETRKWVDQICHLTQLGLVDRKALQNAKRFGDDNPKYKNLTRAETRVICCDRSIFYVGGGRIGLPDQILLPVIERPEYPWQAAEAGWKAFSGAIRTSLAAAAKAAKDFEARRAAEAQEQEPEQPKEEPKKAPTKEDPKPEPKREPLPPTNPEPAPERYPGQDEESPEDRPASVAQRKMVLNLLTKLKRNWPNAETQEEISKCIGRDLPQPARTDHLTWGEADLLVSHYTAKLEAKAERAAKKEESANANS